MNFDFENFKNHHLKFWFLFQHLALICKILKLILQYLTNFENLKKNEKSLEKQRFQVWMF